MIAPVIFIFFLDGGQVGLPGFAGFGCRKWEPGCSREKENRGDDQLFAPAVAATTHNPPARIERGFASFSSGFASVPRSANQSGAGGNFRRASPERHRE